MATYRAIVAFCAAVLVGMALAQTTPDEATKTVRISGRLVYPDGSPVSFGVRLERLDQYGRVEATATTSRDGHFTLITVPGPKYMVSVGTGMKTPPKMVDTSGGKDIDVGDMVFEHCPAVGMSIPKPPSTTELIGDLKPEQIIIEPQEAVNPYRPVSDLPHQRSTRTTPGDHRHVGRGHHSTGGRNGSRCP